MISYCFFKYFCPVILKTQNMKKVILSVAALFAFGIASAQEVKETAGGKGFAKEDLFISGTVGFSSQTTGDFKTNTFTIAPSVGLFVTDNIAIGARVGYMNSKVESPLVSDVTTSALMVGAFGRYYATPSSDFSFFGELAANYASAKVENGSGTGKANGFNIALAPGVSYFISNNFALEASIGVLSYDTVKPDYNGAESTDTFNLNLNLDNVNLGLVYKF